MSNFHPLEVVGHFKWLKFGGSMVKSLYVIRYRDPQLQAGENYSYLFNLRQKTSTKIVINKHSFNSRTTMILPTDLITIFVPSTSTVNVVCFTR